MVDSGPVAPAVAALAASIADQLGETATLPRAQIERAVRHLGEERAGGLLAEALALQAAGGELLPDGSRARTVGGIFFRLVRHRASARERAAIFWPDGRPARRAKSANSAAPFTWEDYAAIAPTLMNGAGEATTVKITVIGRPKQVQAKGDVVLVPLVSEKLPTIPKGLPTPTTGTAYALLIARKQWQKVAAALEDPGDRLIAEGYPTLRPGFAGITVLATNVTTTGLQATKRQAQQAAQEPG